MKTEEIIYKIWQRASQMQFTCEHLAQECSQVKDWEDIKSTFNEVTRLYKQLEELFLLGAKDNNKISQTAAYELRLLFKELKKEVLGATKKLEP